MEVIFFSLFVLSILLFVFYTVYKDPESLRFRKGRHYFIPSSAHHEATDFNFLRQDHNGYSHYQTSPGMNLNIIVRQHINQVNVQVFSPIDGFHQVILAFQYNYRTDKLVFTKKTHSFRSHTKWLTSNIVHDFKLQQICPIHKDVKKPSSSKGTQSPKVSPVRKAVLTTDNREIQSLFAQNQTLIADLTADKEKLTLEAQHQVERAGLDLHNVTDHFNHTHPNHRNRLEPTFLAALTKLHEDLLALDEQLYAANQQRMDYLLAVVENR